MPPTRLLPLGMLFLLVVSVHAQSTALDSLHQQISSRRDTVQVNVLLDIGWTHWDQHVYDSTVHYCQRAIQLAEALDFGQGIADGHYLTALTYTNDSDYKEALKWYDLTLAVYRKYQLSFDQFYFFANIGSSYTLLQQPSEAIAYFDSARIYLDSTVNDHRLRWTEVMGLFYDQQNQFEKALEYRRQGWKEAVAHAGLEYQLFHLYDLAYQFETLDQHDSAIHYLQLALPLVDSTKIRYMEWSVKACLGICWLEKGEYAQGLAFLEEAEPIGKAFDATLCCGNTAYQAKALVMLGRGDEAEPYLARARAQLPEIKGLGDRKNVLTAFYDVYKHTGQLDSALLVHEQLMVLKDTIAQQAYRRDIAEMEVRYATEAKEYEIARQQSKLARQRLLLWGLALGTLLLISLVIVYRRYYHEKQRAAALLATQNEQLQHLDRAKSTFFANISHEFRTPLTLIMGPLEEAIDTVREFSLRDQLLIARRNAQHLLQLVVELLDLSRLEAGTLRIQKEPVQVLPRLRRLVEAFRSLATQKQIELRMEAQFDEDLTILIDGPKLDKIVTNLLGNALKFSPKDSQVTWRARWQSTTDDQGVLEVDISDEGPGISEEEQVDIFERYYQGRQDQPPQGGTGIGLALARELATAMNGELTVSSRLQQGSTFRLRLPAGCTTAVPVSETVAKLGENSAVPYQSPASTERPALLVVEDQPDMQEYLRHVLSPHFYTYVTGDAETAYRQLERAPFDLILSDLMLPGEDGLALLKRIRQGQTIFQQLPFIMLTARAGQEELLTSLRLGVDDYLTKPFQAQELIARLHNVLENYRARLSQEADTGDHSATAVFLQDAEELVKAHLADSEFTVKKMARHLAQSQRKLERIIKEHTGLTPVAFIREIRLRTAYTLLKTGALRNVSEVGQSTGFPSAAHFSRVFSQRFGVNPSEVSG